MTFTEFENKIKVFYDHIDFNYRGKIDLMIFSNKMQQIYKQKSFLDDSTSQTSSSITNRFTRKQDDRSSSRKSLTRRSSENSIDNVEISKFYIKMASGKEQRESQPLRPTIIHKTQQIDRTKKRNPTPLPGHFTRQRERLSESKKDIEPIQTDLLIAELQRNYDSQKQARQLFEKRASLMQKQLKIKVKRIHELQLKCASLIQHQRAASMKMKQFQEIAENNQTNLTEARNNLQKLKGIIKKNRFEELELQNSKIKKALIETKNELNNALYNHREDKEIIANLSTQINVLKRENENLLRGSRINQANMEIDRLRRIIYSSKTQKQQQLQRVLQKKQEDLIASKTSIQKLQLKLAHLNRKKSEQIQSIKVKHGQQMNKMRNKISIIHEKYINLKQQYDKIHNKNHMFSSIQLQRKGIMYSDHRRTQQQLLFDLSP